MLLPRTMTSEERNQLWWRLLRGLVRVQDEVEELERCPPVTRDEIYGAGILQRFYDLRDELAGLVDLDLQSWPRADSIATPPAQPKEQ